MKIAVIYQSAYGTTKKYAEWLAEELEADLWEKSLIRPESLSDYDLVIYGGGIYASGILGIDLVTKHPIKNLILFTVGLANPAITDYSNIIEKNLPLPLRENTKIFHLRGGIDYKKLSLLHRALMAAMKKFSVDRKSPDRLSSEDKAFLESYGKEIDFTNIQAIQPIINYVQSISQ